MSSKLDSLALKEKGYFTNDLSDKTKGWGVTAEISLENFKKYFMMSERKKRKFEKTDEYLGTVARFNSFWPIQQEVLYGKLTSKIRNHLYPNNLKNKKTSE
jgi:hypothetical protein